MNDLKLAELTLRDYFAGQAIAGVMSSEIHFERADWMVCAMYAYEIANEMLAARLAHSATEDDTKRTGQIFV